MQLKDRQKIQVPSKALGELALDALCTGIANLPSRWLSCPHTITEGSRLPPPSAGLLREAGGAEQNTYALVASEDRREDRAPCSVPSLISQVLTDVGEGCRGTEGYAAVGPLKGNAKSWETGFQITFLTLCFPNSLHLPIKCMAVRDMYVPLGLGSLAPAPRGTCPYTGHTALWMSSWNHGWAKEVWLPEGQAKQTGQLNFLKATQCLN